MVETVLKSSLQVKTVSTAHGTARVVLLPGHEFGIEHFLPHNLTHETDLGWNSRARQMRSKIGNQPRFVAKHTLTQAGWNSWTPASEARLARYINGLGVAGVKVEEPLAVVFRKPGKNEVMYREINANLTKRLGILTQTQRVDYDKFIENLKKHGITPVDHSTGVDQAGTIHLVDIEAWEVEPEKAKELGLTKGEKDFHSP